MSDSDRGTATSAEAGRAVYTADPRVSRFTVRAFAGGLLSAFAHNPTFAVRRFTSSVGFDPSASIYSLAIAVEAASLQLTDEVSESDRREIERIMRDDVLEVGRFPTIEFQGVRVDVRDNGGRYHATVSGPFTLHGATRDLSIEADIVSMGTSLRIYGEFPVRQSEFGITPVSVAAQAIKVKDELKCTFDLVCRQAT